ncbi:hypothetical protein RJZ90_002737 [Blastomyces dermatitidis]
MGIVPPAWGAIGYCKCVENQPGAKMISRARKGKFEIFKMELGFEGQRKRNKFNSPVVGKNQLYRCPTEKTEIQWFAARYRENATRARKRNNSANRVVCTWSH